MHGSLLYVMRIGVTTAVCMFFMLYVWLSDIARVIYSFGLKFLFSYLRVFILGTG